MTPPDQETDAAKIYKLALPHLESALEAIQKELQEGLKGGDFYVTGRLKSARSLIRKIHKNSNAIRSWDSIDDKVGLRIICSTKQDMKKADQWVAASRWNIKERIVKSGNYNRMFYPGVHIIVEDMNFRDHRDFPIVAEIQLRTRAQDAWSVVSHMLLYKGVVEPPRYMKRVITRLSVVVEMFDDEVQRMIKKREKLPTYLPARMMEALDDRYEALTGEPSEAAPDLSIMQVLANAYESNEKPAFDSIIERFCQERDQYLRDVLKQHGADALSYIGSRDWLFSQPEILAILERAFTRPHLLLDAIRDTDLHDIVMRTCLSAGQPLPVAH